MRRLHWGAACLALAGTLACGDKPDPNVPPTGTGSGKPQIDVAVQKKFDTAMARFVEYETKSGWDEAKCREVAEGFDDAASEHKDKKFPLATYNAGLVWQRCGNDKEAKSRFEKAMADGKGYHHARAQLIIYRYKQDKQLESAIKDLNQVIYDAKFENVVALTNVAMLHMLRDKKDSACAGGSDNMTDFDCAKLNLQQALAKDDSYMPAFNQLALYYMQLARKRGQAKAEATVATPPRPGVIRPGAARPRKYDVAQLELAALVCWEAIRKNPGYAPIYNTQGLVFYELGQINRAVSSFAESVKLDPRSFEAHMNLAAVNLSFRGFTKAEEAYKNAVALRPNDYDARLGLALALRGQIGPANYDKQVAAVQAELDKAKGLPGARPDVYFNEAILTHGFRMTGEGPQLLASLDAAEKQFQTFLDKVKGRESEYAEAVQKAKDRIDDIQKYRDLLKMTAAANAATPPAPPPPPAPAPSAK